jgi:hypothetical protein
MFGESAAYKKAEKIVCTFEAPRRLSINSSRLLWLSKPFSIKAHSGEAKKKPRINTVIIKMIALRRAFTAVCKQ